jgi:superfamily I DNA/RNA helicase/RecB family exonuclease
MSVPSTNFAYVSILGFERENPDADTPVPPTLDPSQRAVVDLADARSAAVIGAPGTGKTTTVVELVADRVLNRGWSPDELVVLTPSRASATGLRDRIALRLGVPTLGPMARTVNSLAFEIVRAAAATSGAEPPRLLTGAEQDQIIADLLAGEIEDESDSYWPAELGRDVRRLRGFRTELRDLMARAVEYGIPPEELSEIGTRAGRAEWVAAARFIVLYNLVKASYRSRFFDSTELVHEAAELLESAVSSIERLRLVVLDDAQESTEATLVLVRALAARGVTILAVGDPDITTGAFRGAIPDVLGRLGQRAGVRDAVTLYLGELHRAGGEIRALTATTVGRIGAAGAGLQRKTADGLEIRPSSAVAYTVASRAEEIALIARRLRERHVLQDVPWGEMAIIVRSSVGPLSQALQALEVPVSVASARTAVRDEYAVRGLILVLEIALGRVALDGAGAVQALTGAIGGLDSVSLRRLKAALRHEELIGDLNRSGDELLVEALSAGGALATIDNRVGRRALRLANSIRDAAAEAAAGATIEELLWGIWQRSGLEKTWFDQSLGSGLVAEEANRHLDAIVALFAAAKRFVERTPDAEPSLFLDGWTGSDLPEDTLAPRSAADAVAVGTPAAMIGREFDTVVVAGVQESVWPNLRIRGSLLGAQDLSATLDSGMSESSTDRRTDVLHDELRLFAQAVSRARSEVTVTAVSNEDSLPSPFLRMLRTGDVGGLQRYPLSLRGMVGQLRRELVATGSGAAAAGLARLAEQGVPGANPDQWYGLAARSTNEPLVDLTLDDAVVRVSPSRMESFELCALHWLISEVGGGSSNTAANLGTLIHAVADDPEVGHSPDQLFRAVESRWGELQFEASWQSAAEKVHARDLTARLSAYLDDFDRAGGELIGSEIDFALPVAPALLRGKIDRVEAYPDGTAVIVDLKTGKRDPSSDAGVADHAQLGAYQLAFASGAIEGVPDGLALGGAKLVIVSKGNRWHDYADPHQPAFTDEQLEDFRARVASDAEGMAGRVFVAQIGTHCLDPWSFGSCRIHVIRAVSA